MADIHWLLSREELTASRWAEMARLPYLHTVSNLVFLGIPLGLLLTDWSSAGTFWPSMLYTMVSLTIIFSPVFFFQSWETWKKARHRINRIFHLDPHLVRRPPPGGVAALPCSILTGRWKFVEGILYCMPSGLFFVPRVRRCDEGFGKIAVWDTGMWLGPTNTITLEHYGLARRLPARLLYPDRPYVDLIVVGWGDGKTSFFRVDQAATVLPRLQRVLDDLCELLPMRSVQAL
jgi:hypothetical protein